MEFKEVFWTFTWHTHCHVDHSKWIRYGVWKYYSIWCNKHYKKTTLFWLRKLVRRYPKWHLSNLTKVPSWTSHFGLGHFELGLFGWFFYWIFLFLLLVNNVLIATIYDIVLNNYIYIILYNAYYMIYHIIIIIIFIYLFTYLYYLA